MALPDFPIDEAYLIGGWLASGLWGAFTVVFIFWIISLLSQREKRSIVAVSLICLMYLLATVHISCVLARLIQGFIVHANDDGGPSTYFADIGNHLNRSKDMIYITLIVLGDSILVWRCFMVWNKNWYIIAIPIIMVLGTAISGYGAVGRYFGPNPYTLISVRWARGMLSVSMITNIIVTFLTAGRIWWLAKDLSLSRARYRSVILLIVESGVFMSISKLIEFTLFLLAPADGLHGLNALYIPMDCMPQIMGIFPTFIMLAVSRGMTSQTGDYGASWQPSTASRTAPTNSHVLVPMQFASVNSTTTSETKTQQDRLGGVSFEREDSFTKGGEAV